MIHVFVITGTHRSVGDERVDLAKFFALAHAEAHMHSSFAGSNWRELRIDERQEEPHVQHYAHGGEVGKPDCAQK
jgi:hypothetical protein